MLHARAIPNPDALPPASILRKLVRLNPDAGAIVMRKAEDAQTRHWERQKREDRQERKKHRWRDMLLGAAMVFGAPPPPPRSAYDALHDDLAVLGNDFDIIAGHFREALHSYVTEHHLESHLSAEEWAALQPPAGSEPAPQPA